MTWVAAVLIVVGALVAFVGSIGLLRMPTFFERVHPPTMGSTVGAVLILAGSMLHFGVLESRVVLQELLIAVFITFSTPVTYLLLGRAALQRRPGD